MKRGNGGAMGSRGSEKSKINNRKSSIVNKTEKPLHTILRIN
jgi:hypothetical protein